MANLEKINALITSYESNLVVLRKLFMTDGVIDTEEQKKIDQVEALLAKVKLQVDTSLIASIKSESIDTSTLQREPQFISDPEKKWNFDTFLEERKKVVVDRKSMTSEEIKYFENYEKVAQAYIDAKMKKFEPGKESPITGKALADSALKTYMKYGDIEKVVPVEMMLSQLQFETFFGSRGEREGSKKSPFNVGVYDSKDATFLDQLPDIGAGIEMYFDLMAEDYLSNKTPEELENNFTNETNQRYATDSEYEEKIKSQSNAVEKFAEKEGLEMPNEDGISDEKPIKTENNSNEKPKISPEGTMIVPSGWGINQIAVYSKVSVDDLKSWNIEKVKTYTTDQGKQEGFAVGETIIVKKQSTAPVIEEINEKPKISPEGTMVVPSGWGINQIAVYCNVSVDDLKLWNIEKVKTYTTDQGKQEGFAVGETIIVKKQANPNPSNTQKATDPQWITKARGYIGKKETKVNVKDDPFIKMLFEARGNVYKEWAENRTVNEANWCAAFVSYCLDNGGQTALSGYDGIRAKSYLNFGTAIDKPVIGAIAVFPREGGGHVGFVVGGKDGQLDILGGNQSNSVCIKTFSESSALGFVIPSGWIVPEGNKL